jgi:hypothetical protein
MDKKPLERWIDIYTTYDESEATIMQGLLEDEGIPCRVESARVSQLPVSVGRLGEIKIFVHTADFEKAEKLLQATRAEEEEP